MEAFGGVAWAGCHITGHSQSEHTAVLRVGRQRELKRECGLQPTYGKWSGGLILAELGQDTGIDRYLGRYGYIGLFLFVPVQMAVYYVSISTGMVLITIRPRTPQSADLF